MSRKLIALMTATLLFLGLLPMGLAFASASGTAQLVQGINVFPGTSTYGVEVRNGESTGVAGLPGTTGKTVNGVHIILPASAGLRNSTAAVTAPEGWTVHRISSGGLQTLSYETVAGNDGGIAPGGSMTFEFPVDAVRPINSDRSGALSVGLSSDRGKTKTNASPVAGGTLTSTVRILEVLSHRLFASSPAGVRDGSGTTGQSISYNVVVKNHAQETVRITPSLSSNMSGGEIGAPSPTSANASSLGARGFTFPVKLGASSNSPREFTASATAPNAEALAQKALFTIQTAPDLNIVANSFSPTAVQAQRPNRPAQTYTFKMSVNKTGEPALRLRDTTNLHNTLSFGDNVIGLQQPVTISTSNVNDVALSFEPSTVVGADGSYDAAFNFVGIDENGHPFNAERSLDDLITIDTIIPKITVNAPGLPNDKDGHQQIHAKTNDTITVSGTLDPDGGTAVKLDFVELRPNVGDPISVTNVSRTGNNWSGSVAAPFAEKATSFKVHAQASDAADNKGTGQSAATVVDNFLPVLYKGFTRQLASGTRVIEVEFDETNTTKSACFPSQWKVDGQLLVTKVTYSNGNDCTRNSAGPDDHIRVLHISGTFGRDDTMDVQYTPGRRPVADPAKDGAGWDAAEKIIKAVQGIVPEAPSILNVTRTFKAEDGSANGREAATPDEGKYFTHTGGNDMLVQIGRAAAGYQVEVLNASGQRVRISTADSSTPTTDLALPAVPGEYLRRIRLINAAGAGPTTDIIAVVDQTAPGVTSTARVAVDQVKVDFSEIVWDGAESSENWHPYLNVNDPEAGNRYYYQSQRVDDGDTKATRIITVDFEGDTTSTGGAEYIKQPGDERHRDRAGNYLRDTMVVS